MSASGMTTMAFLPEVSAKRGVRGARRANSSAVSKDPVSTTAPSPPCPIRWEPTGPSAAEDAEQHVGRDAGGPAGGHGGEGDGRGLGRGLHEGGVAGGQRGQRAADRDGQREVPRPGDGHDAEGAGHGAVEALEPAGQAGVIAGEVDRLGHLGVRLGQRLARLLRHEGDQLRSPRRQLGRAAIEQVGPLGRGDPGPARRGGLRRRDHPVDARLVERAWERHGVGAAERAQQAVARRTVGRVGIGLGHEAGRAPVADRVGVVAGTTGPAPELVAPGDGGVEAGALASKTAGSPMCQ